MYILRHKILTYFMSCYEKRYTLDQRRSEARRVLHKFSDRVPIIVKENDPKQTKLDKKKYLVPRDLTIGQFIYVLRKRMKFPPEKALFCFVGKILPTTSSMIGTSYDSFKSKDDFLYITVSCENTFGSN